MTVKKQLSVKYVTSHYLYQWHQTSHNYVTNLYIVVFCESMGDLKIFEVIFNLLLTEYNEMLSSMLTLLLSIYT